MKQPLSGAQKSAIVLLALGVEQADDLLRALPGEAVREVTRQLAAARGATDTYRKLALTDFLSAAGAEVVDDASGRDVNKHFAGFGEADTTALLDSIRDEHPQTIAMVLAHLSASKAAEVLAGLPTPKQVEVVKRIAGIEQISSEVIDQVERGLRQRLGHIVGGTIRAGGVSGVAEILNSADRRVEREILHTLEEDAPEFADQIRRAQAILEELMHATDQDIRAVCAQLDIETIALALRTARQRLRKRILRNLAPEEARHVEQELKSMEAVRISDIESAQQRVAEVVSRLSAAGDVSIAAARGSAI